MRTDPRARIALACLLAVCALELPAPPSAIAQKLSQADLQAKTAFRKGESFFRAGRYLEALAQFSAGYELSHRPLFLFNMGECARKLGERDRARSYYERYLADDPNGPLAAKAKERLTELGPPAPSTPTRPAPSSPPAGGTGVPEKAPLPTPAEAATAAEPDRASTGAATAGRRAPMTAAGGGGSGPLVGLPAQAEPVPDRPLWKRWPVWVGVGVGAAAAATAVLLLSAQDERDCTGTCIDLR